MSAWLMLATGPIGAALATLPGTLAGALAGTLGVPVDRALPAGGDWAAVGSAEENGWSGDAIAVSRGTTGEFAVAGCTVLTTPVSTLPIESDVRAVSPTRRPSGRRWVHAHAATHAAMHAGIMMDTVPSRTSGPDLELSARMHNLRFQNLLLTPFLAGLVAISACTVTEDDSNKNGAKAPAAQTAQTGQTGQPAGALPTPDVTANFAEEDTVSLADMVTDTTAALASITPNGAAAAPTTLPFTPPKAGPTTLHVQILLDRANFSPGMLSGVWDNNAKHALTWFRVARGMDSSAVIDKATYGQLTGAAGNSPLLTQYTVTDADMKGPFVTIPSNVYQKAKLNCLCYQSVGEEMGERFHSSQSLLRRLNPGVNLKRLKTGSTLWVPNVARDTAAAPPYRTTRIIISKKDFWTHALDASGNVVAHYPSTLGNSYDPSPDGDFSVTSITKLPAFHYQPTLFHEVPDSKPEAHLPKGPNSPVGVIWMALSKEHYGIHGTEDPATIGVTQSHGCVRLTNWDAWTLGSSLWPGVPVTFQ